MSKYTTELRFICESVSGLDSSTAFNSIEKILESSAPKIFNFDFPIYDESYRLPLEIKILRHFYTREICEETYGLWKLRLCDRLNLIMPYFNRLYKNAMVTFDPMQDEAITRTYTKTGGGSTTEKGASKKETSTSDTLDRSKTDTSKSDSTADTSGYNYECDTPQGSISDDAWIKYLSKISKNTQTTAGGVQYSGSETGKESRSGSGSEAGTTSGETTFTSTDEYTESVTKRASGADLAERVMKYRESLINIDEQLFKKLNDLFFILW